MSDYLSFYNNSLEAAAVVVALLAFLMLGRARQQTGYTTYLKARSICGGSFAMFSLGLFVEWAFNPFLTSPEFSSMWVLTYFHIGGTLFVLAQTLLLHGNILSKKRKRIDISCILAAQILGWTGFFTGWLVLSVLAVIIFLAHVVYIIVVLWKTYYAVVSHIKNVSSDDTERLLRWLAISCSVIICYGILLTILLPATLNNFLIGGISTLICIPIFIYIYISHMGFSNRLAEVAPVIDTVVEEIEPQNELDGFERTQTYQDVCRRIEQWIANKGFLEDGITSQELANKVASNRLYISHYFNSHGRSFRDTINELRIQEAKRLLRDSSLSIEDIAAQVGLPGNKLNKQFLQRVHCTPAEWRMQHS